MPFVGLGALVWIGAKALAAKIPAIKVIALAISAPFIGLAFVVAMPFLGLGTWLGSDRDVWRPADHPGWHRVQALPGGLAAF